jgi:hypothetical protein
MPDIYEHGSEVARLLTQICEEYKAARQGLTGLTQGTSQHQFITTRMERMGALHSQLSTVIGDKAMALIAVQLDHVAEEERPMPQGPET